MSIPDAKQAFNAISFDDMDGDGESDVLVSFIHENGDTTELIWIWDPAEHYVFRADLSTVAVSGGDLSEYVGLWEYQGKNLVNKSGRGGKTGSGTDHHGVTVL